MYVADQATGTETLYIDGGVFQCSNTDNAEFDRSSNANDLYIGGVSESYSFFTGALDDIRIYNRALSASEITALYTEGGWPATAEDVSPHLEITPLTDTVICPGESVNLALAHFGDSLRWSTLAGVTNDQGSRPVLSPSATTTYEITSRKIIYTGICPDTSYQTEEITVVVSEPPTIEGGANYPCVGQTDYQLDVVAGGGEGPYTFEWQPTTGLSDPRVQRPTLEVTGDADYRVIVTDANGCSDTANVSVTVLDAPVVDILRVGEQDTSSVTDTLYLCEPDAGIELIAEPEVEELFLSYRWIEGDGLDRTDTSHVTARPSAPTTYIVELKRAGCLAYDTIVVVPAAPPEIDAGEGGAICPGESLRIGAAINDTGLVYAWSSPETLDDASHPRPTAAPAVTTTYNVTATDTVTGCIAEDSVTVVVRDMALRLGESSVDFGTLDGCTSELTETVAVHNDGDDEAELLSAESDKGVVQLAGSGATIAPGESVEVALVFAPQEAGDFTGEVVLRFGPCGDSLVVQYTGRRATASVTVDRRSIDFGRTPNCEADSVEQIVVVRNDGTDPATIEAPTLAAPYAVLSPALPVTVGAGDTLVITVSYAPTVVGTYVQTMALPYRTGSCSDSLRVSLSGEIYLPMLEPDPLVLDFGVLDGCTADTVVTLVIKNPGEESITLRDVELPSEVTLLTPLTTISPGDSVTLKVRFAPVTVGPFAGSMEISYGPCPANYGVYLSGEKRGVSFAVADTLDFGELCLGEAAALPLSVLLRSEGTGDGAVVEAVVSGAGFVMDEMDRMDIMDADGALLRDGEERWFAMMFEPTAEGTVTGTLRLRLEPCGVERTVVLRGSATRVQLSSPGLDFGTQSNGTTTTGILTYTNTGKSSVMIDRLDESAMNGTPFRVLSTSPPLPVELGAGESIEVEVEYAVVDGGSSASLGAVIVGPCDTTVVATIRGTGESTGFIRMRLPQLAGEPGEALQLTMEVSEAGEIPPAGLRFRAEVSVEPSVLVVADATPWRIANNGERIIEVEGVVRDGDPIAASIPVTALLGRVESSPLRLVTIEPVDLAQQISLEVEDGRLEILGLCREGGVRLFDPYGEIAIKSITPSPTQDRMTITYAISETGDHRMYLVDVGGREVLEIFSGMMLPGTFEVVRDVGGLSSGAYRLVLETPTVRVSEGVMVW